MSMFNFVFDLGYDLGFDFAALSRLLVWITLAVGACAATVADAAEARVGRLSNKPLWELGAIGGGGLVPEYPASDQTRTKGIGAPFFIYRGKFLRLGDKGLVRGRVARERDWELDVSVNGSFSAKSDNNKARQGMPDLDWLGEAGPRFQYTLARAARDAKIDFELPVRAVLSTDLTNLKFRGFVAAPRIAYQNKNFLRPEQEIKLSFGGDFGTTRLADYFYRVAERFETATRPRYQANPGYLGSSLKLTMVVPLTSKLRLFLLGVANFHYGAANENSPLFRDKVTFGIGGAVSWLFYQSSRPGYR